MAKVTLSNPSNLQNEVAALATMAANNTALATAMEKALFRDGTSPNFMAADFDMNSHRILNLPAPISGGEPVRISDLEDFISLTDPAALAAAVASATASANSASISAGNASTSATNAHNDAAAVAAALASIGTIGTMANQNATAVGITGGAISGVTINNSAIGATTANTGKFTALTVDNGTTGTITLNGGNTTSQIDAFSSGFNVITRTESGRLASNTSGRWSVYTAFSGVLTEQMRIDNLGNLIFTAGYLNFGGASSATGGSGGYGIRDNAGTIQLKNSGGAWTNIPTSSTSQWTTNVSDIYYTTGKVGIGVTSPTWLLDMQKDQVGSSYATVRNANAGPGAYAGFMAGNDTSGTAGQIFMGGSANVTYGGANSFNFIQTLNANLTLGTNNTSRVWISGSGKVGVGNSTPNYALDVATTGNLNQIRFGNTTTDVGGYLLSTAGSNAFLSAGVGYDGTNWKVKTTDHTLIGLGTGVTIFAKTGDSVGATATLNRHAYFASDGTITFDDYKKQTVGTDTTGKLIKNAPVVLNALLYGCDNTGVANCGDIINTMFGDLDATRGGVIYFPAGRYKIDKAIGKTYPIPANKSTGYSVTVCGDGPGATQLVSSDNTFNMLTIIMKDYRHSFHMRDIGILANGALSSVAGVVLYTNRSQGDFARNSFTRCTFAGLGEGVDTNYWGAGLGLQNVCGTSIKDCTFAGSASGMHGNGLTIVGFGHNGTFTVDNTTDIFTSTAHGLSNDDVIKVTSSGTLPAGMLANTDYYVISSNLTANTFQLSATRGGTALNVTTNGSGTHTFIYSQTSIFTDVHQSQFLNLANGIYYDTQAQGVTVVSCNFQPVQCGIFMTNGANQLQLNVTDCQFDNRVYPAIYTQGGQMISVKGCIFVVDSGLNGINSASQFTTITGNQIIGSGGSSGATAVDLSNFNNVVTGNIFHNFVNGVNCNVGSTGKIGFNQYSIITNHQSGGGTGSFNIGGSGTD